MADAPDERVLLGLLGVDTTASWEQVRRAFRDAVRASHPDLNGGDVNAEQRLKTLNRAWESVNTPAKWARYVARPASGPGPAGARGRDGRSPPPPTDPSLARLRVQRALAGSTGLRQWRLELDGEVIGSIANGATTSFELAPGGHTARVFYDWYSSRPLAIQLQAGHELRLGCRQQANGLRSVTAPKRALVLEPLGRHPIGDRGA